jgi:hypothetical protein
MAYLKTVSVAYSMYLRMAILQVTSFLAMMQKTGVVFVLATVRLTVENTKVGTCVIRPEI